MYPRRVIAAADVARFATSDDPADSLRAHEVLAGDPTLSGRVVPTFSPDRYLDPGPPRLAYRCGPAGRGDRHRHRGP